MGTNYIDVDSKLGREVYSTEDLFGANTHYPLGYPVTPKDQSGIPEMKIDLYQNGRCYKCSCRRVVGNWIGNRVIPMEIFEEIKDDDGKVVSKRVIASLTDLEKSLSFIYYQ